MSVDLPAPFSPTIATVAPAGIVQVDVLEHGVLGARVGEGDVAAA